MCNSTPHTPQLYGDDRPGVDGRGEAQPAPRAATVSKRCVTSLNNKFKNASYVSSSRDTFALLHFCEKICSLVDRQVLPPRYAEIMLDASDAIEIEHGVPIRE